MSLDLSVIIPSRQRADLLAPCLESIFQHLCVAAEILVIDDGSADAVVSRTAQQYPGVRVLRLSHSVGFCAAMNMGIRAARGDVVQLLNDDTEVCPGWDRSALAHFTGSQVAAVAPLVLYWPGTVGSSPVDSAGDGYYVGGIARKRGHGRKPDNLSLQPRPVFGASASSGFFRRETLLAVGAFPPSFRAYFEDVDLAFRLQRAGYQAIFEPASRVLHHVSASYGRPRQQLLEQQSLNEERVFWRNLPVRALSYALPQHLAVLVGKAFRRWAEGNLRPFMAGRVRILGELGKLRKHRRSLAQLGPAKSPTQWQVDPLPWPGLDQAPGKLLVHGVRTAT